VVEAIFKCPIRKQFSVLLGDDEQVRAGLHVGQVGDVAGGDTDADEMASEDFPIVVAHSRGWVAMAIRLQAVKITTSVCDVVVVLPCPAKSSLSVH
jgi:hypothetical protein